MATVYGTDVSYETALDDVVSELGSLVTAMVGAINPKLVAVYEGHTSQIPMTFPCATVGLVSGRHELPAIAAALPGPATRTRIGISIRVLIGYAPVTYKDDRKIGRLINSVLNWFNEHRKLDSGAHVPDDVETDIVARFDDTDTVGGEIRFDVFTHQTFTAA